MNQEAKITSYYAAATAAKSRQSCPTLCDPIDGSPPGSVPGILQARTLECQASSCVQEWTSACLSSCSLGDRHLLSCMSNLRCFPDDARGCQCPFVLCLHPHYLLIGVWASHSYQERIGKSRSFGMWHHHRGYVSNFLVRQPHLRCVEKVGNPLQTKQGN